MKCNIEVSNGIKYLIGININKRMEIADCVELPESTLFMMGLIIDKKEYNYGGKNHVKYTKLWGCIDDNMNIIIPFIFQKMKREFDYIIAETEEEGTFFPTYHQYYFNLHGIPVIYSTKKEMEGWDWVEDSDYKTFSIAQKDGKQGVIRNDGRTFIEPIYEKIEMDLSIPLITVTSGENNRTDIIYRKDKKIWSFLPVGCRYIKFAYGLYVLLDKNQVEFVMDNNFNMVVPPWFDHIDVYSQCIIVKKDNKYGVISRKKTIHIDKLKNPIYALITKLEFDDIKICSNRAIILKDSLQGILDMEDGNILCYPRIPIKYSILPHTLNDNAVAVKIKPHKYGYFDLDGHFLFEINIEDDKIKESSIRGFRNGKLCIWSDKFLYIFNKDGSYEKTHLNQHHHCGNSYHNYEAERWDALTDGMEGNYPGSGVDYDIFGFD